MSYASEEDIKDHLETLQKDTDDIEEQCRSVCYHMKGVTWNEAWGMSPSQRSGIIQYVNKIYAEKEKAQSGKQQM